MVVLKTFAKFKGKPLWQSLFFNPFHDEGVGEAKRPPASFSPVTSTNVGIGPQNFPFVTLVKNFKAIPSPSPNLLNLNQEHLSNKVVFLVKSL